MEEHKNADVEDKDEDRLTNEELENLKKKCLSRMKDNQSTPLVVNPPVLHEFSNSQKLLNFLDEAEEKDVTVLNSVKRSSYNLQVKMMMKTMTVHHKTCQFCSPLIFNSVIL